MGFLNAICQSARMHCDICISKASGVFFTHPVQFKYSTLISIDYFSATKFEVIASEQIKFD